jgi:hypothetical protein
MWSIGLNLKDKDVGGEREGVSEIDKRMVRPFAHHKM